MLDWAAEEAADAGWALEDWFKLRVNLGAMQSDGLKSLESEKIMGQQWLRSFSVSPSVSLF